MREPLRARALYVTRRSTGGPHAGDQVHVRRMLAFLESRIDLNVLELEPLGKAGRIGNLLRAWPIEMTGFYGSSNVERLNAAIAEHRPDVVYLIHEALFPFADHIDGPQVVLFCMNAISCLAETDPAISVRITAPIARRYENRFFRSTAAQTLILVSRADAQWFRGLWHVDMPFPIAAPGALRPVPLGEDAGVSPELLITGSYAWWRKRRDLKEFASHDLDMRVLVTDPRAAEILGDRASLIELKTQDFGNALRFGMVTDRFLGGFKLKSLEYVANNAVVLSRSDIRPDFHGLPDANLFVRFTPEIDDVRAAVAEIRSLPPSEVIPRFRAFQSCCTARFEWDACLQPLLPPFLPNPDLDDLMSPIA
jgi:hypothetical protein